METSGYTYLECAERMQSLLDSPAPTGTLTTNDGYFTNVDVAWAIETAERTLMQKLRRSCHAWFEAIKSDIVYPSGRDSMLVEALFGDPVESLVTLRYMEGSQWRPLARINPRSEFAYQPGTASSVIRSIAGYMRIGPSLRLVPTPTTDITLASVYVPCPKRLTVPPAAGARGGWASGSDYPTLPASLHHLIPLRGAVLMEAKRRDNRNEMLLRNYEEALADALANMDDWDQTAPDSRPPPESDYQAPYVYDAP